MQTPASSTAFVETLSFDDPTLANALFGPHNAHLNVIAERTGADLSTRGTTLAVTSDDPALRERILNLFTQFYGLLRSAGSSDVTASVVPRVERSAPVLSLIPH